MLRIDAVRESIYGAYTLGVAELKPRQLDNAAYKSDRLERARDLLVLAFGAQIEGGDGDAQCHKDVARAWSDVLVHKAKEIMLEHGQGKGGVDLVNLWVVMAAFGRSYGNSDGESDGWICSSERACSLRPDWLSRHLQRNLLPSAKRVVSLPVSD